MASWQADGWCQQPVMARGAEFGDGLFETLRINAQGEIPLWSLHRQRLTEGLVKLNLPIDSLSIIDRAIDQLLSSQLMTAVAPQQNYGWQVKLLVERAANVTSQTPVRGYAYHTDQAVVLSVVIRPAPGFLPVEQGMTVGISPVVLSQQPLLAGIKHLNRLEQVLARQQFAEDWQECLMLNPQGDVIEGCMSNLYILENQQLITPLLDQTGVEGVARRWLFEQAESLGLSITQGVIDLARVRQADGVLYSNTLNGFSWVERLEKDHFSLSSREKTQRVCATIQTAFIQTLCGTLCKTS